MKYSRWWSIALWAGFLFGSCQMRAAPDPCSNEKLTNYLNLGVTGCSIDDKVFSNFEYNAGGGQVGTDNVMVFIENDPLNPGLDFSSTGPIWAATSSPVLNYTVRVQPGGNAIVDNSLAILLGTVSVSGDGSVSVIEYECLGALFTGPKACPGTLVVLGAFVTPAATQGSTVVNFAPVMLVDVQTYISLSATKGAVSLGDFEEQFSEVPEPRTWGLLGPGIAALVLLRRRRQNVPVRRLAYEAADTGLLSPELAASIRRVKGAKRMGVRLRSCVFLTPRISRTRR